MKNKRILITIILLILSILTIATISNADMGPKPSITIYVKNLNSTDYFVDLLTTGNSAMPSEHQKEQFAQYRTDGWTATAIRDSLLWGDVEGNEKHMHLFNYFGTPTTFKIILQLPDDSLVVSETITRKDFNAEYTIDAKTGKVTNNIGPIDKLARFLFNYAPYLGPLFLTILVEYWITKSIIGKKEKMFRKLALMNLVTNVALQILVIFLSYLISEILGIDTGLMFIIMLIILEVFVVFAEYKILNKIFPDCTKQEIKKAAIIPNIASAAFTLVDISSLIMIIQSVM